MTFDVEFYVNNRNFKAEFGKVIQVGGDTEAAYNEGHKVGYGKGYSEGFDDGQRQGYNDGYDSGLRDGKENVFRRIQDYPNTQNYYYAFA